MLSNGAKDYKAKLFENHDENIHFLLNTPLSLQRQVWESAAIKATLPAGVCIETVNDTEITAEWISYPDSINTRIILYFHGGGNSQGSCLTHRKLAACLAQYSGCRTLVLEYPLAPENRFPAALLNCHQAYLWLLANGYSAEDIILAGDSSGGGLVMSLLLLLKQHQDPLPDSSVLLSPIWGGWSDSP